MSMEISTLQKPPRKVWHQGLQLPLRTSLVSRSSQLALTLFYWLHKGIMKNSETRFQNRYVWRFF